MSNQKEYKLSPVGRIVQGDLFNAQTTDHAGRPRETPQFYVGLAIEKTNPEFAEFYATMQAVAQRDFPRGEWQKQDFAWKLVDGDGIDTNGNPNNQKPGFAGCWVLRLTSGFAPEVYDANCQRIVDPQQAQRGFYARVNIAMCGNGDPQKSGIYLNLGMTQIVGYGEVITSGPAAGDVFAPSTSGYVPQGMSTTPIAPAAMPAQPGVPQQPMQPQQPVQQPMQPMQPQQPMQPMQPMQPQQPMQAGNMPPATGAPIAQQPMQSAPAVSSATPTTAAPGALPAGSVGSIQPNPAILNGPQQ